MPTSGGIKYTVTLDDLGAEGFEADPSLTSGCQSNETWSDPMANQQHQVTFTYNGIKLPSGKRAEMGLEFAGLTYVPLLSTFRFMFTDKS